MKLFNLGIFVRKWNQQNLIHKFLQNINYFKEDCFLYDFAYSFRKPVQLKNLTTSFFFRRTGFLFNINENLIKEYLFINIKKISFLKTNQINLKMKKLIENIELINLYFQQFIKINNLFIKQRKLKFIKNLYLKIFYQKILSLIF